MCPAHFAARVARSAVDTASERSEQTPSTTPLVVGAADDRAEAEADRVAHEVIVRLHGAGDESADHAHSAGSGHSDVRRSAPASGAAEVGYEGGTISGDLSSRIEGKRGGGSSLPAAVRSRMEAGFGGSLADVRVHADADSATLNRALSARAFTTGKDIFFGAGEYQPDTSDGELVLAHELAHVQQHTTGRIARLVAPSNLKKAESQFKAAIKTQAKARERLLAAVNDGAKQTADVRLKNACEWILNGKAKLYAVTRTGDTDERVAAEGRDPAQESAFFPAATSVTCPGHVLDQPFAYDKYDLTNNHFVEFDDNTTDGWNVPGVVAVVDPQKMSKAGIWTTLKHEVQHDSDKNMDKRDVINQQSRARGVANKDLIDQPALQLERYKTEYRAYNYEGNSYAKYSPTKKVQKAGFEWTERQWQIFQHIYGAYSHTEDGWTNNGDVGGGVTFREAVVAYADPDVEGFNKWDSVRIDDLYKAMSLVPDGTTDYMEIPVVIDVPDAVRKLTKDEAGYVLDAPDWKKLMEKKLGDIAYTMVISSLRTQAERKR